MMLRARNLYFAVVALLLAAQANTLDISASVALPKGLDPSKVDHQLTKVQFFLDIGKEKPLKTFSKFDSSVDFRDVPIGDHFLEVYHPHYVFPTYILHVSANKISATTIERKKNGQPLQVLDRTLTFEPVGNFQYFEKRQGVSILKMMMNPMFLMMAVSLLLMFAMPKMMENMDPEELKRIQAEQKQNTPNADPQALLNSFLGVKEEDTDSDSD